MKPLAPRCGGLLSFPGSVLLKNVLKLPRVPRTVLTAPILEGRGDVLCFPPDLLVVGPLPEQAREDCDGFTATRSSGVWLPRASVRGAR